MPLVPEVVSCSCSFRCFCGELHDDISRPQHWHTCLGAGSLEIVVQAAWFVLLHIIAAIIWVCGGLQVAIRILEGRIDRVRQQQEAPAEGAAPGDRLGAGAPPLQTPEQEVSAFGYATKQQQHACEWAQGAVILRCRRLSRWGPVPLPQSLHTCSRHLRAPSGSAIAPVALRPMHRAVL